ncbi:hypothetical protein AGABI1DRAFT_114809 [Agaricus bisporus var. burnettii JB137-S8]|uniref:Uncharacterized protein n=1 Tax=Agaricus bisporus var. burnettii (strain JB137-S8 / ATCC MYA-4627 / FGSC 10392) TaxID=597362 RepID=K5XSJ0_AGABU|nr:uncharacterized protein AGABI1DRAFT_114809 [Agaricus bisporus var. burnettii JB137-S8]EKM77925.1 hypothetical protein AGABI1DRAFT_114809 [Agaricus bisporus var. burnettii JB137-S8]
MRFGSIFNLVSEGVLFKKDRGFSQRKDGDGIWGVGNDIKGGAGGQGGVCCEKQRRNHRGNRSRDDLREAHRGSMQIGVWQWTLCMPPER